MMTFIDDAKYCAAVVSMANKYNKYGINVAPEMDYVNDLEQEIKYNVTKSETEEVLLTNRVFLLRHLLIKMCRDELGTDANIELFRIISDLYTTMGELIIACHNTTPERYDHMDALAFKKNQVSFAMNNNKGNRKVIYTLIYTEIEYVIKKYCKHEFVETKDRADNN